MSNFEKAPNSIEDAKNDNNEWDMRSPQEKNEIDFSSTANEDVDEDNTASVSDAEKMQDTHMCTLRGPGEELGWNERVTKRQIARAYKEKLREKSMSESALHDRVISAFGRFLDVPGYGYDDGSEPTEAQRKRLEELYQMVVEEEKANRNIFEKIVGNVNAKGAFTKVLAVAVVAGLAIGVKASNNNVDSKERTVAILEEHRDSLEGDSSETNRAEEVGGITANDIDKILEDINQSSVE